MPIPVVTLDELLEKQGAGALILAEGLPRAEFDQGHLPGAVNIPLVEIVELLPRLLPADPQAVEIITYGPHERSPNAHMLLAGLQIAGYTRSAMYRGGKEEWTAAGLALERGPSRKPSEPSAGDR
jgi:rhodanese-related sulfurtransferase